jgi:hypothetical protein
MNIYFTLAENDAYDDGYDDGQYNGYIRAVEKACEWLYQRQAVDLEVSDIDKFVNEFKKAMEE